MTDLTLDSHVKWLAEGRQPVYGTGVWEPYVPRQVDGPLVPGKHGLHYVTVRDSVEWLQAECWRFEDLAEDDAQVAVGGLRVTRHGQITVRVAGWDERTARLFTADCAEHVLPVWESVYPDDDRPARAVEAARGYELGSVSRAEIAAARAAAVSAVNESTGWDTRAGRGVAWAAESAGWVARAAWAAAWAAESAGWAAKSGGATRAARGARAAAWAANAAMVGTSARAGERAWQARRLLAYLNQEVTA